MTGEPLGNSNFTDLIHDLISKPNRYAATKLMEILLVRELVARLKTIDGSPVVINLVNPGTCRSALNRDINPPLVALIAIKAIQFIFERTTEVGSRTYVYGAAAGPESHGELMSDGELQQVESWIYTDTGKKVQAKLFDQTMTVLEQRRPGIGRAIGLVNN